MNCTTKLHGHIHEARKIQCNNFHRAAQERVNGLVIYAEQALPLDFARFLRLAKARRWPRGVPRDGNAMAAQYPARLPVRCLAACPRNFPAMAGHWQRQCRRMSVKTTRKTTCLAPDLAAPCPHWKLARRLATWPRNNRATSRQWPGSGSGNAAERPSRRLARQLALRRTWPRHVQRRKLARRLATWSRNSRAAVRTMASDISQAARPILAVSFYP